MTHVSAELTDKAGVAGSRSFLDRPEWVVPLLCILGAGLRLPNIGRSLWYDEMLYAARLGAASWSDLLWFSAYDRSTPLFSVVMFFWVRVFGAHELALRLPSLLFGIASIVLTYRIARLYGTHRMAALAALLLCVSPVHVWYSQEATPYAMCLCLLLGAIYVGARIRAGAAPRGAYVAYTGLLWAAVFTHYYSVFFLLPLSVLCLTAERPVRNRLLLANGVVAVCVAAAIGVKAAAGVMTPERSFLRSFTVLEWWMLFFNWFLHGNTIWTVNPYHFANEGGTAYLLSQPLLLVCQFLFLAMFLRGLWPKRSEPGHVGWRRFWELGWNLVTMPLALLLLTLLGHKHLYIERYAFMLLPFFWMVVARGATGFSWRALRVTCVVAAVVLSMASYGALLLKRHEWTVYKPNPDWHTAADYLVTELGLSSQDVVFTSTPADALVHYLHRTRKVDLPEVQFVEPEQVAGVLAAHPARSVYLVKELFWEEAFQGMYEALEGDPRLRRGGQRVFEGVAIYEFVPR
jgi:4-amino-4-deoxy-L-arabinose transferase-like glycosyltransferase